MPRGVPRHPRLAKGHRDVLGALVGGPMTMHLLAEVLGCAVHTVYSRAKALLKRSLVQREGRLSDRHAIGRRPDLWVLTAAGVEALAKAEASPARAASSPRPPTRRGDLTSEHLDVLDSLRQPMTVADLAEDVGTDSRFAYTLLEHLERSELVARAGRRGGRAGPPATLWQASPAGLARLAEVPSGTLPPLAPAPPVEPERDLRAGAGASRSTNARKGTRSP